MSSVGEIASRLGGTLELGEDARASLDAAVDLLGDAVAILNDALSGSASFEAEEVTRRFADAERDVRDLAAVLVVADRALRAVRSRLTGGTGPPSTGPATPPPRPSPEVGAGEQATRRVEQLRRELPPPVIAGSGRRTHGRWTDDDGNVTAIVSGQDPLSDEAVRFFRDELGSRRIPRVVKDVEVKLAAHMRKHGIRSASLVINNVPCPGPLGCESLIPVVLPPGYTMTVYGSDGTRQIYEGGGTSEWVP